MKHPKLHPELRSRFRSKLEADYANYLEALRLAGDILRWEYEPETFTLAHRCKYTPDWKVWRGDALRPRHEWHATTGWTRDDATVKLKWFADRVWPIEVYNVRRYRREWITNLVLTLQGVAAESLTRRARPQARNASLLVVFAADMARLKRKRRAYRAAAKKEDERYAAIPETFPPRVTREQLERPTTI
jgi:hypothetical protein